MSSEPFEDDWYAEGQSTLTYGKKISTYGKFIIMEVMIYYAKNKKAEKADQATKLKAAVDALLSATGDVDQKWESFMHNLEVHSPEGVMAFAFDTYGKAIDSLLFRTFYTFGKIKPLSSRTEWFDNYRLNGLCNGFNNVLWNDKGRSDCYAVGKTDSNGVTSRAYLPINEMVECANYRRICKHLVGALRKFIIRNNLYQTNDTYTIIEPKKGDMSYKEICDQCYRTYPFYWAGAHGCDFYLPQFDHIAISLRETREFNDRYPSAIIGWILNTSTYVSHNGAHWIAVLAKGSTAYVVDSAGKSLTNMKDGGAFRDELSKCGYTKNYNTETLQSDGYSCGMFAVISCYVMLCNDCDIIATANSISKNGTGLVSGKTITSFTQVLAGSNVQSSF